MQPTAPSYRQTRQRFLGQRLPFVRVIPDLLPNGPYAKLRGRFSSPYVGFSRAHQCIPYWLLCELRILPGPDLGLKVWAYILA
jgi:hypothetical protein